MYISKLEVDSESTRSHAEISGCDLETNFDSVHSAEFYVIVMSLRKFEYRWR